jgi:hypothetical protein
MNVFVVAILQIPNCEMSLTSPRPGRCQQWEPFRIRYSNELLKLVEWRGAGDRCDWKRRNGNEPFRILPNLLENKSRDMLKQSSVFHFFRRFSSKLDFSFFVIVHHVSFTLSMLCNMTYIRKYSSLLNNTLTRCTFGYPGRRPAGQIFATTENANKIHNMINGERMKLAC